jgi:hypothetical protein
VLFFADFFVLLLHRIAKYIASARQRRPTTTTLVIIPALVAVFMGFEGDPFLCLDVSNPVAEAGNEVIVPVPSVLACRRRMLQALFWESLTTAVWMVPLTEVQDSGSLFFER